MQTTKFCPTCRTRHTVEMKHEWPIVDGRRIFEILLSAQSTHLDLGKLEGLCPRADDGQRLVAEMEWVNEREVMLRVMRVPQEGSASVRQSPTTTRSRPDMETEAAELGLKLDKRAMDKLNDAQLAVAIREHKKKLTPQVTDV